MKWFVKCLHQYADFSGRARRKEYWYFTLFNCIFQIAVCIVGYIFGWLLQLDSEVAVLLGYVLMVIWGLGVVIPSLAVFVRRMHDIGKSGWWYFIGFVPLIGAILFLIWLFTEGDADENMYGVNPKMTE